MNISEYFISSRNPSVSVRFECYLQNKIKIYFSFIFEDFYFFLSRRTKWLVPNYSSNSEDCFQFCIFIFCKHSFMRTFLDVFENFDGLKFFYNLSFKNVLKLKKNFHAFSVLQNITSRIFLMEFLFWKFWNNFGCVQKSSKN